MSTDQLKQDRLDSLRKIVASLFEGSHRKFGDAVGITQAYMSQLIGGQRSIGDDLAIRLEKKLELPLGMLINPRICCPPTLADTTLVRAKSGVSKRELWLAVELIAEALQGLPSPAKRQAATLLASLADDPSQWGRIYKELSQLTGAPL